MGARTLEERLDDLESFIFLLLFIDLVIFAVIALKFFDQACR